MRAAGTLRSPIRETALGLVSTQSFPAIVGTADMMLKSAGVTLVGYEKTGSGFCTAIVRGGIADVRLAVQVGEETAKKFGQYVSSLTLARPLPNLEAVLPISARMMQLAQNGAVSQLSNLAIGLLETRGFPAMVGAADMMLKSAEVQLSAYETIGAGLCTVIIRGSVANVAMAIEAATATSAMILDSVVTNGSLGCWKIWVAVFSPLVKLWQWRSLSLRIMTSRSLNYSNAIEFGGWRSTRAGWVSDRPNTIRICMG